MWERSSKAVEAGLPRSSAYRYSTQSTGDVAAIVIDR